MLIGLFIARRAIVRLLLTSAIALFLCNSLGVLPVCAAGLSPVRGLVALKAMAGQSVAYDVALANQKPTVLEFYADWCGSCQSMAPLMSELHGHYGDRINFVMVNIDDTAAATVVKQYAVTGIPHLLTLASTGEVQEQFVGRVPAALLDQAIAPLAEAASEPTAQSLSISNLS